MVSVVKILLCVVVITCSSTPASAALGSERAVTPQRGARREVAVTFDDLPATNGDLGQMQSITRRLLKIIVANRVPAVGFVNEGSLYEGRGETEARTALLRAWLDVGLELGNHTYSHVNIDQTPLAEYQEDVIRGEAVTSRLSRERGMRLRYFRHPMLRTGPTLEYKQALDGFLAKRGYTVAPVTIDNNDFIFAYVYADAKARGDKEAIERVADAYVPYMERMFDFFERLSAESFGYEVKQTLLLHANEINADYFGKLVRMMKRRGYSFITLEDALKDKAYCFADAPDKLGVSWIHRWRSAKNLETRAEPSEPEFVTAMFKAAFAAQRRQQSESAKP